MSYSAHQLTRFSEQSRYCANFITRTKSWAMACGFTAAQHIEGAVRLEEIGRIGGGTTAQCDELFAMLQKEYRGIDLTNTKITLEALARAQFQKQR